MSKSKVGIEFPGTLYMSGCGGMFPLLLTIMQDDGCCVMVGMLFGTGGGDLGGEGLSRVIIPGLTGYPELETEDGPGVVETRDWLLLDEILVVSEIKLKFKTLLQAEVKLCF